MSYGDFLIEEQKARMQAIKDSEFRAANDDGEPATDLVGVGPNSYSPPDVVRITVEDEEFGEDFTVKVTIPDLIAAIQAGVESGTIKGATEKRHAPDGHVPSIRYSDACSKDCRFVDVLVIPVSDGGSET